MIIYYRTRLIDLDVSMNTRRKNHVTSYLLLSITGALSLTLLLLLIGHINKTIVTDRDVQRLERYYAQNEYSLVIESYESLGPDERLLSRALFVYGMSTGLTSLGQGDDELIECSIGALQLLQSLYELPQEQLQEVLELSGRLYYAHGAYRECIETFSKLLERFEVPDRRIYELYIGLSQGELGLVSQMEKTLEGLLGESRTLRLKVAGYFQEAGAYRKALDYLEELEQSSLRDEQKCSLLWKQIEILDTIGQPVLPLVLRILELDCSAADSTRAASRAAGEYRALGKMIEAQEMSRRAKAYAEAQEREDERK